MSDQRFKAFGFEQANRPVIVRGNVIPCDVVKFDESAFVMLLEGDFPGNDGTRDRDEFSPETLVFKNIPRVDPLHHDRGVKFFHDLANKRLFDGFAALLGIRSRSTYEGQAAIELEYLLPENAESIGSYSLNHQPGDWLPILEGCLNDISQGEPTAQISAKIHNSLAEMVIGEYLLAERLY